jgi:hypothetical protein
LHWDVPVPGYQHGHYGYLPGGSGPGQARREVSGFRLLRGTGDPSTRLRWSTICQHYGSDLWGDFFAVGYELFGDKDKLQTTFIAADIFDDRSPLTQLTGKMNIIYTGAFFHLFSLEDQEKIAARVVQLLVPLPGSLIIGRQSGSETPGEFSRAGDNSSRKHFRHNAESWNELWDRVGKKTGSSWLVDADLTMPEFTLSGAEAKSPEMRNKMQGNGLRFTVRRK